MISKEKPLPASGTKDDECFDMGPGERAGIRALLGGLKHTKDPDVRQVLYLAAVEVAFKGILDASAREAYGSGYVDTEETQRLVRTRLRNKSA